MIEIKGNLWEHVNQESVICITTNGTVKNTGECVMGRGCALEAKIRYPNIARRIGDHIRAHGNTPFWVTSDLITFPVKHNWWEKADPQLILASANWLTEAANNLRQKWFILPRPGCGNGKLKWEDVKPLLLNLPDNVKVISR